MKQLLVHLHIYYHDQVDYFISKLKNINGVDWDLVVTFSKKDIHTINKITALKPDVMFLEVENYGYDIWPFIKTLKNVELNGYDYIIKLHTKRRLEEKKKINRIDVSGLKWRNELVDAMLFSPAYFRKVMEKMDQNPNIGMISSLITFSDNAWDIYEKRLREEMSRFGLSLHKGSVNLGTMFIGRSSIFIPLKEAYWLNAEYFHDHTAVSGGNFSISHIYERFLSLLPLAKSYLHIGLTPHKGQFVRIKITKSMKVPLEWFFCLFRKGEQHRKALRICGMEFYIGKPQEVKFVSESKKIS